MVLTRKQRLHGPKCFNNPRPVGGTTFNDRPLVLIEHYIHSVNRDGIDEIPFIVLQDNREVRTIRPQGY